MYDGGLILMPWKRGRTPSGLVGKHGTGPHGGFDAVAAYAQSVRIGEAALRRLEALAPELATSDTVPDPVILDARTALRQLDEAIGHTAHAPVAIDPDLIARRDRLAVARDALPARARARIAPAAAR